MADAVNVICWLVCGEDGLKVKLALRGGGGGLATVTVCWTVAVCCGDALSFTVRTTVYEPGAAYAWVAVAPVPVEPSPKAQLKVYGCVPPDAVAVNVTWLPTLGDAGV